MDKVILFGGTFDPPHNGHIEILKACKTKFQPKRVLVMPANIPHAVYGQQRFKMLLTVVF